MGFAWIEDKVNSVHLYLEKSKDTPITEKHLMAVVKIKTENPFLITSFLTNEIKRERTSPLYTKCD